MFAAELATPVSTVHWWCALYLVVRGLLLRYNLCMREGRVYETLMTREWPPHGQTFLLFLIYSTPLLSSESVSDVFTVMVLGVVTVVLSSLRNYRRDYYLSTFCRYISRCWPGHNFSEYLWFNEEMFKPSEQCQYIENKSNLVSERCLLIIL